MVKAPANMRSNLMGWKRLGLAISLVWVLAVCGLATYEWFQVPKPAGYFVEATVEKTGEPYSALKGNPFADLVPVVPRLMLYVFLVTLVLPIVVLWLVGELAFWVSFGFKREQP